MTIIHKISIALIFGITGCNEANKEKPVSNNEMKPQVDKISLVDLNGRSINLRKYKGKTVFINFWATWCKPCIEEMPYIANAQNILGNEVVFLLASSETIEQIVDFRDKNYYKFNYARIENSESLNIQVLPTTFIISPGGNLSFLETGLRKWDDKNNINLILKIAKEDD